MVDWLKQISSPSTTTTDIFAGDVLNWVIQYHDDIDLAAGDPNGVVHIFTETVFNSGKLKFYDANKSHNITFTFPDYSEDKTVTFPSTWSTSDEVVGRTTAQTLTNKSIDSNTNALSNIGDSAISSHTSTKITITNKAQLNNTIVYTGDTQTLTAKTLNIDANTIKHSTTNAAGDLIESNGTSYQRMPRGTTGQVLTSTASDIAWQTPAGANQLTFLPDAANTGIHWGLWTGGAQGGTGSWSSCPRFGTVTGKQDATTNTKITTEFATGTTTGSTAGFQGFQPTTAGFYAARNQNFHFKARFQVDALTNRRFAIGMASLASLPPTTDSYLATAVPGFLFRFSDTTDTTIKLLRNDNAGAPVQVDTGLTLAANTAVTLDIYADEPNTRMGWAVNGGAITYYTTDIPANTTGLNYFIILETKTTAAQRLQLYYSYLTQDVVP